MTNIRKIEEKTGPSFKITVTKGRDLNGKKIRRYRTWTPPHPMTERQMEREVQRMALDFEREIELGYQVDNQSKGMVGGPDVLDAMLKKKPVPRNSVLVEKTKALRYRGTAA